MRNASDYEGMFQMKNFGFPGAMMFVATLAIGLTICVALDYRARIKGELAPVSYVGLGFIYNPLGVSLLGKLID